MFFCKENRERLKEENPDVGFGELGKLLGSRWSGMDEQEKKVLCISCQDGRTGRRWGRRM